jgi:hypothetical protein
MKLALVLTVEVVEPMVIGLTATGEVVANREDIKSPNGKGDVILVGI